MKYTNYLINGNLIDLPVTNKVYLKPIVVPMELMIAIVGIFGITTLIPLAVGVDIMRSVKFYVIMKKRR